MLELMRLQDLFFDNLVTFIKGHRDSGKGNSMDRDVGNSMDMDNSMGSMDIYSNMAYDRVADGTGYLLLYLE